MPTPAELRARREALVAHRSSGVARVGYDGRTGDYRSLAEIDRAIEALDREIAAAEGRLIVRQVRLTTIKGLCPDADLTELLRQENHNCSITEVQVAFQDDKLNGRLLQWAACDHLTGEAAEFVSGSPPPEFYQK